MHVWFNLSGTRTRTYFYEQQTTIWLRDSKYAETESSRYAVDATACFQRC